MNASYSDRYATPIGGQKQMLLCELLIGDAVALQNDKNIRLPPFKPAPNQTERYDTVQGTTGGSQVYIGKQ